MPLNCEGLNGLGWTLDLTIDSPTRVTTRSQCAAYHFGETLCGCLSYHSWRRDHYFQPRPRTRIGLPQSWLHLTPV
jgi:hypothetical protein